MPDNENQPLIPPVRRASVLKSILQKSKINVLYIYSAGGIVLYGLAHIFPEYAQEIFTALMVWLAGGIGIAKDIAQPDPAPMVPADLLAQSMDLHQQTLEMALAHRKK